MTGQGFELSPFGPVPIGTPYLNPDTTSLEAVASLVVRPDYGNDNQRETLTPHTVTAAPVIRSVQPRAAQQTAPATSPRSVIQSARARVKQIRAELKRMRALQNELGELERLLKAAKQKPSITHIRPVRNAG